MNSQLTQLSWKLTYQLKLSLYFSLQYCLYFGWHISSEYLREGTGDNNLMNFPLYLKFPLKVVSYKQMLFNCLDYTQNDVCVYAFSFLAAFYFCMKPTGFKKKKERERERFTLSLTRPIKRPKIKVAVIKKT